MTATRVKLRAPRRDFRDDSRMTQLDYSESAPFFVNPRGILAHRVRSIIRLTATWEQHPWWIVEYWCENSGRTNSEDDGLEFDPGKRLVCTRCEAAAIAHGEKTSSELAGRHVCTGALRAINVCCDRGKN